MRWTGAIKSDQPDVPNNRLPLKGLRNVHTQTSTPSIDFATLLDLPNLQKGLEEYAAWFVPHAAETSGDDGEEIANQIKADPWEFLQWYAQDQRARPSQGQNDQF